MYYIYYHIAAQWDKLNSWKVVRDEIEERLSSAKKYDDGISLEIGPQVENVSLKLKLNLHMVLFLSLA